MEPQETTIETSDEQGATYGQIKVNHTVVATIVKMAAIGVNGVLGVGGGIFDDVKALFSAKESDKGVRVSEDENGDYRIEVRVVMEYGCELGKTAENLQMTVAKQVTKMTSKTVASVDVIIDGVKMREEPEETAPDETE